MNNFNPNNRGELCTAEQAGQLLDEIIRVVKATERAPVEGGMEQFETPAKHGWAGGWLLSLNTQKFTPPDNNWVYILGEVYRRTGTVIERYRVEQPKPVNRHLLTISHRKRFCVDSISTEVPPGKLVLESVKAAQADREERELGLQLVTVEGADALIAELKRLEPTTPNHGY